VPPLPPHVTFEQAKGLATALVHGDPAPGRWSAGACGRLPRSCSPRRATRA